VGVPKNEEEGFRGEVRDIQGEKKLGSDVTLSEFNNGEKK